MTWSVAAVDLKDLNVELMTDAEIRDEFDDEHEDTGGTARRLVLWANGAVFVVHGPEQNLLGMAVAVSSMLPGDG